MLVLARLQAVRWHQRALVQGPGVQDTDSGARRHTENAASII